MPTRAVHVRFGTDSKATLAQVKRAMGGKLYMRRCPDTVVKGVK
jgi:hypothetical protein